MIYILLIGIILAIILLPNIWASSVIKQHEIEDPSLPGNGGELAQHLIQRFNLQEVKVEETEHGDHYDPEKKRVRLRKTCLEGKSLTAVATATHEVGHAIQHDNAYRPLVLRNKWVHRAQQLEKLGSATALIAPMVLLITKSPLVMGLLLAGALSSMLVLTLVHLITLPVEIDASFNKALPILEEGQYLNQEQLKIARKILLACALTYMAQSLASLLNLGRWLVIFRR